MNLWGDSWMSDNNKVRSNTIFDTQSSEHTGTQETASHKYLKNDTPIDSMSLYWVRSVSYTHLDVYKRQVYWACPYHPNLQFPIRKLS